jgi:CheY-like chemotaxis protein
MKPLRILLVEDNQFFPSLGSSGAHSRIDLLLLDLNLPKIDGAEVLRVFRQHANCVRTPVVVFSSSGAERDRSQFQPILSKAFRSRRVHAAGCYCVGSNGCGRVGQLKGASESGTPRVAGMATGLQYSGVLCVTYSSLSLFRPCSRA